MLAIGRLPCWLLSTCRQPTRPRAEALYFAAKCHSESEKLNSLESAAGTSAVNPDVFELAYFCGSKCFGGASVVEMLAVSSLVIVTAYLPGTIPGLNLPTPTCVVSSNRPLPSVTAWLAGAELPWSSG